MNDGKLPMAVGKANQDLWVVSKTEPAKCFQKFCLEKTSYFLYHENNTDLSSSGKKLLKTHPDLHKCCFTTEHAPFKGFFGKKVRF